jgi:hypothetical protein
MGEIGEPLRREIIVTPTAPPEPLPARESEPVRVPAKEREKKSQPEREPVKV